MYFMCSVCANAGMLVELDCFALTVFRGLSPGSFRAHMVLDEACGAVPAREMFF